MESEKTSLTYVKEALYIIEEFFSSKPEQMCSTILSLNNKYANNNSDRPSIYLDDNIYSTIFQELLIVIKIWKRLDSEELLKRQKKLYLMNFIVQYLKRTLSSNELMEPNELISSDSYKLTFILMIDLLYFENCGKQKNEEISYHFALPKEFQLIFQILCLTSVESISSYFSNEFQSSQNYKMQLYTSIINSFYQKSMKVLNIINDAINQKLKIDISQDIKEIEGSPLGIQASWNLQLNDSIIKYFNGITFRNFKKLFYQFKNAKENQYKKLFKVSIQFSNLFEETEYYHLLINEPDLNFFLMQYLTPNKKLPDLHSIKRYSNILNQLFEGIIINKSDISINSIFENTNLFNYYKEVLQSDIVKHFFSSEKENLEKKESNKQKYINYENYLKILNESFIKNYLVFVILPKGVKAFTNRYLHIFFNTEGFSCQSYEEEDKTKLIEAMCLLVLLQETAHFVKRYKHYDEAIENWRTIEEKGLSEEGKIFFQSIFGKPKIEVITLQQAKQLLDINTWKQNKTKSIFEKLGEKNEKNTISFLLTGSQGFCLHHRKKSYPHINGD